MQAVPALNVCAIGAEISSEQPGCGQFVFVQTKLRQSSTASNTEKCRQLPIEPIFVQPLARKAANPTVIGLLQRRHLLIGWLGLLVFLTLGVVLEALHGFKAGFYLDAHNSARRLMWTLCHAHGTLFSLVHIAFACSLGLLESVPWRSARLVSDRKSVV